MTKYPSRTPLFLILIYFLLSISPADTRPLPLFSGMDFHVINDNYTGDVEAGKSGNYIGADDFLTVSYLLNVYAGNIRNLFLFNTVTSRKYNYRYDLLRYQIQSVRSFKQLDIHYGLGLNYKGNLNGQYIQNKFHEVKDLPPVYLPYDRGKGGVWAGLKAQHARTNLLINDSLIAGMGMEAAYNNLPGRMQSDIKYHLRYKILTLQAFTGYRLYYSTVHHYSEHVKSGFIFGTGGCISLYKTLAFNMGIMFFPVKNIVSDPLYKQKDFNYSPQMWTGISYNTGPLLAEEL